MLGENHGKETSWYNQWSFDCCCTWYQLVHANPKDPNPTSSPGHSSTIQVKQSESSKASDSHTKETQSANNLAALTYQGHKPLLSTTMSLLLTRYPLYKKWCMGKYGDLDRLNRATSAEAMLNQSLMPTEKRGDISSVTPTGWHNKKLKKVIFIIELI